MEEKKMTKKEFWIRFGIWVTFAVVIPFVYLATAYGLFESKGTTLSGWGVFAIVFVTVMLLYIVKTARDGMPKGTLFRQCIDGYMLLIPIIVALVLVHNLKNTLESLERFLIVLVLCEAIAVPINPMQKWAYQNHVEQADGVLSKAFARTLFMRENKDK